MSDPKTYEVLFYYFFTGSIFTAVVSFLASSLFSIGDKREKTLVKFAVVSACMAALSMIACGLWAFLCNSGNINGGSCL